MLPEAQRSAASAAIHRLGEVCSIMGPTPGSRDGYGKNGDPTWSWVADEPVVRSYQSGDEPGQDRMGGTYQTDSPLLVFMFDSMVQTGHRVTYLGTVYEVNSITRLPTHLEAATTVVN